MSPDHPDLAALGRFVREQRKRLGFTQTQLGERTGWEQERISNLENAKYGNPSLAALARLAAGLDTPLQALLEVAGYAHHVGSVAAREGSGAQETVALYVTLQRLVAIEAATLTEALDQASDLLVTAMGAEKVDAFLYDPPSHSLVALGTSNTPMGRLQKERGLDRVPLANRGRTVVVYERGVVFCTGHADRDPGVEIGVTETLGVRSILTVPLRVGNEIRGVLGAVSSRPDHFSTEDQRFFETAAQWVGVIAHRAELVEAMRQTAADEARRLAADELMTALAHELGNYLAPLKGRIDVLRRRLEREGRARDEEDIYEAAQAVSRLQQLVTQLLDSARLDAGLFSLALQPVDLVPLIEQVVQDMGGSWPALETRLADELEVQADPVRIAEVLVNLLTNAIQYSPDEAPILLTATAEQRADGPWAVVRIQNEGRVIDPDLLPHLFDRFVSGGQSGGLGLGLYLARRIVEAHGGVISVDARAEQGTTFVVAVPCRSPD